MEIGNVIQSAGQVAVSAQPSDTQQVGEKKTVTGSNLVMQKDFQVNLNEGLKTKLVDFANLLQNREQLIKSLPENIQKAVVELLQQMSSDIELPQGLSSLITGQKNIAEELKNMSHLLDFAAVLNKDENVDVKAFVEKVIENGTDQLSKPPAQSAKELLQLAKQLSTTSTVPQSDFKQAVEEYLQAKLPENVQNLSQNGQKIVDQLTKLLGKNMPVQLQQFAQENNLPKLPGVWSTLKVVDALTFKDIQPKTLQAAADLLRQIAQEMSPEKTTMSGPLEQFVKNMPAEGGTNKSGIVAQLEQFVKSLPAEVSSKAAVVTQLEQFVKSLPAEGGSNKGGVVPQLEQFVKSLPAGVNSKAAVITQLEQFVKSLPAEVGSNKGGVVPQLEQFVKSLPAEVSSKAAVVSQLEQFVKSLPAEVGSNKGGVAPQLEQFVKSLPAEVSSKSAVVAQLEQFVKSLPVEGGSNKGGVVPQLEQFVKSLPAEVNSKAAVITQLEQFVKRLPAEGGSNKGGVVPQLEQFVKSLPAEVSSKAAVVTQLEQFVKTLPAEGGSNKGGVVPQLEQFVKSLPAEVSSKAAVVSQLEQFVKSLPTEGGNNKGGTVPQLEQFVKNLPSEVGGKIGVVSELEQFIKALPAEAGSKVTATAQLEQFLRTLPPEISKALQQVLKQGNIPTNLRELADTFSNAAVLNEHMTSEQQTFSMNLVGKFVGKAPSMPAETNNILTQLAAKFSDTATTLEQIKVIVTQLKTELFAGDPKLLEEGQDSLQQLTKLFEENIPRALQEGATKHNLTELPKIWVLLKALGTDQWQNNEQQNLQKSAALVKELAQSIYKSTGATGEKQIEHSILSFSVPLQVATGIYYPAHIHVYHQQEQNENSNQSTERKFETWLRVCVDTENIGMVDSVFRLYGENKLDVRVTFPSSIAADEFYQDIPNIRKNIENNNLNLTEIMVNKI